MPLSNSLWFCNMGLLGRIRIAASTLYKWQEKYAVQHQSAFVEIIPESAQAPASCAMILQIQQVNLHFQTLPDTDWLAELMHNLKP